MHEDLQRSQLLAWLRRRDAGAPIELTETHISVLAMQGDRVYKVRKHVSLPFIDLSTAERRRSDCERELRVNRRFAPDVYLGLVDVIDERGRVVDTAVEMRRMLAETSLSNLAIHGARAVACLDRLASDLARIHEAAPRAPHIDAAASRDAIAARWDGDLHELAPFAGRLLDEHVVADTEGLVGRFLSDRDALFSSRIDGGRICEGHGDLLADDIFCTPDGPRVLDAIEFDDRLRWTDALADVAFLAMDLEFHGRPDLAKRFLNRYAMAAHDRWPASLEGNYVAHRAVVRSKVMCLRHEQNDEAAAPRARQLLALARSHLYDTRVRLVLVGGPPGTGKTTLSRRLADRLHWTLLRSDVIRKELAGRPPTERAASGFDEGLYTAAFTERTYATMLRKATTALQRGDSVVLDASWSDTRWRQGAAEVAAATSSELIALECAAPERLAATRIDERLRAQTDASDADSEIASGIRARFAPWPDAQVIDTTRSVEGSEAAAVHAVR